MPYKNWLINYRKRTNNYKMTVMRKWLTQTSIRYRTPPPPQDPPPHTHVPVSHIWLHANSVCQLRQRIIVLCFPMDEMVTGVLWCLLSGPAESFITSASFAAPTEEQAGRTRVSSCSIPIFFVVWRDCLPHSADSGPYKLRLLIQNAVFFCRFQKWAGQGTERQTGYNRRFAYKAQV